MALGEPLSLENKSVVPTAVVNIETNPIVIPKAL